MGFILTYHKGKSAYSQKLFDPSPEMIEQAIDELLPALDYYVILDSDPPINDYTFIQTVVDDDKDSDEPILKYMIEVQIKNGDSWIQYRKFIEDADVVKKMFRMFALEVFPDVSDWDDVTAEIKKPPQH